MRSFPRLLIAALAGVGITLSLAPFDWMPLAALSPVLLYHLLTQYPSPGEAQRNPRTKTHKARPFWLGWFYGLGVYGSGASWVYVSMTEHSNTSAGLATLMTTGFVAALALCFALQASAFQRLRVYKHPEHKNWTYHSVQALTFLAVWVVFEWLKSFVLTGFPWLYLGYSLVDTPWQRLAPIGGVWLASAWVLAVGLMAYYLVCGVVRAFEQGLAMPVPQKRAPLALLLTGLLLGPLALPALWTEPVLEDGQPKTLEVALIQANIDQNIKWQPEALRPILQHYQALTESAIKTAQIKPDVIIWPETAIPALFSRALVPLSPLLDRLDQQNIALVSGLPTRVRQASGGYADYNSIGVLSSGFGLYHKQRLVPFGEYLPLRQYLHGLISFFELPMSSFRLPNAPQTSLVVKGHHIAASICYEIAYPQLTQRLAKEADWLLTVSNDTWFGRSIAPDQHYQIARMRAIENGRTLVRATNNGISGVIDPLGQSYLTLPRFSAETGQVRVTAMQGQTPFQQLYGLGAIIPCLLWLAWLIGRKFYRTTKGRR